LQGIAIVTGTLLAFIGLIWLREQILHGGGPDWLENEMEEDINEQHQPVVPPPRDQPEGADENNVQVRFKIGSLFSFIDY
jgi:E3 ubiquitin-protein ligase MARCH6